MDSPFKDYLMYRVKYYSPLITTHPPFSRLQIYDNLNSFILQLSRGISFYRHSSFPNNCNNISTLKPITVQWLIPYDILYMELYLSLHPPFKVKLFLYSVAVTVRYTVQCGAGGTTAPRRRGMGGALQGKIREISTTRTRR